MKIAVLGCGSIGRRHLRNLKLLNQEDLLAFDPLAEARDLAYKESGVRTIDCLDDVWRERPEVVFVTSPSEHHVAHALAAARQGCHVFIEKPLSHSSEGLQELHEALTAGGLRSTVACNMRFHPGPKALKQLLADRAIGTLIAARIQTGSYLPRWRPAQDYRVSYSASITQGGAILDCIHELDLALWFFGEAELLYATTLPASSIGLETDGLAELLLRHKSGILCNVHLNFIQRDYRRTVQIIGTEGTLYWDFSRRTVECFGLDGNLHSTIPEPEGWELNQMYVDEIAYFLESLTTDLAPLNPVSEGERTLSIALAARDTQKELG